MSCILKFTKGHNYIQIVGGVMVLVLCRSSNDAVCLSYFLFRKVSQRVSGLQT